MDERIYKRLVRIATIMVVAWVGWSLFELNIGDTSPVTQELAAASRYLEDGQYEEALASFKKAQRMEPDNIGALRGQAQALMQLGAAKQWAVQQQPNTQEQATLEAGAQEYYRDALAAYDNAITKATNRKDESKTLAVSYANRGILKDRMGDYSGALADYLQAIKLEPQVTEGPGFMTRFLRNQAQKPPTIADRANYIAEQLSLPREQRQLKDINEDAKQRAYKL